MDIEEGLQVRHIVTQRFFYRNKLYKQPTLLARGIPGEQKVPNEALSQRTWRCLFHINQFQCNRPVSDNGC